MTAWLQVREVFPASFVPQATTRSALVLTATLSSWSPQTCRRSSRRRWGAVFTTKPCPPTTGEPVWHTTETVDYNILLSGELVLMVDAGEVTLHPGDVVVQRNTAHAWRNPTNAPVHWVAVLVPLK